MLDLREESQNAYTNVRNVKFSGGSGGIEIKKIQPFSTSSTGLSDSSPVPSFPIPIYSSPLVMLLPPSSLLLTPPPIPLTTSSVSVLPFLPLPYPHLTSTLL